tara:strand:- start:360 stop:677 length:318 start_codon:yes stop_codon:yes gene_type:complete
VGNEQLRVTEASKLPMVIATSSPVIIALNLEQIAINWKVLFLCSAINATCGKKILKNFARWNSVFIALPFSPVNILKNTENAEGAGRGLNIRPHALKSNELTARP